MAVQGPFKKYFSLQNWILKFQKWQKVGGALFLLLPGMRVEAIAGLDTSYVDRINFSRPDLEAIAGLDTSYVDGR